MENTRSNNTIEIDNNQFRFNVDVYIFREEEHMTAYCPSLDLATTGTDFQDAVKNFYECLQLHVECCMEMGTFEEDLKEHGWKISEKKDSRRNASNGNHPNPRRPSIGTSGTEDAQRYRHQP